MSAINENQVTKETVKTFEIFEFCSDLNRQEINESGTIGNTGKIGCRHWCKITLSNKESRRILLNDLSISSFILYLDNEKVQSKCSEQHFAKNPPGASEDKAIQILNELFGSKKKASGGGPEA